MWPGVLNADVNLATLRSTVSYVPLSVTQRDIRQKIIDIGFESPLLAGVVGGRRWWASFSY